MSSFRFSWNSKRTWRGKN